MLFIHFNSNRSSFHIAVKIMGSEQSYYLNEVEVNTNDLPNAILAKILGYLDSDSLKSAALTCKL